MHDRIIRHHSHDTPANPLMTHPTNPLLRNHHPPIPAPLPSGPSTATAWRHHPIPQVQHRLALKQRRLPQPGHDARLVDGAVGAAHAPAEVGLQLGDRQGVGHEGEGGGSREPGTVLGEEVERGGEVGGVFWGWGQVEGEEGVVDGGLFF